jgi:hypothetical protein
LFKDVLAAATSRGYQKLYSPGLLAAVYVIAKIINNGLHRTDQYHPAIGPSIIAVSLVSIVPLVLVQKAINYNNEHIQTKSDTQTTNAEKAVIVVGIILFVLAMLGTITPNN